MLPLRPVAVLAAEEILARQNVGLISACSFLGTGRLVRVCLYLIQESKMAAKKPMDKKSSDKKVVKSAKKTGKKPMKKGAC